MNTWYGPVTSGGARSSSQLYALLYDYFTLRTYTSTSVQVLVAAPVPVCLLLQVSREPQRGATHRVEIVLTQQNEAFRQYTLNNIADTHALHSVTTAHPTCRGRLQRVPTVRGSLVGGLCLRRHG